MYLKRMLLTCCAVLGMSAPALADSSHMYIGLMAASFDSKYDMPDHDGGMLNFGMDLNNFLSLELAGGTSSTTNTPILSSKIDYVASAFLRFNLRFDKITLYALSGYSDTQVTTTQANLSIKTKETGISYGYGIDFFGSPDLALSVRRVEFFENDQDNIKSHLGATMFGITYYFDSPSMYRRY